MLEERKDLGWKLPETAGYEVIISPKINFITNLIKDKNRSTLHIFSGMRHIPIIVQGLKFANKYKANYAIMSEPRGSYRLKGKLRYLQSLVTERKLRINSKFILAIGRNGPPWFNKTGYTASKVFPFAYFVDSSSNHNHSINPNNEIKICYVGRLVKMKGVYDLLNAILLLPKTFKYKLTLIGGGKEEKKLKELCTNNNIIASFTGAVPINDVPKYLYHSDIIVLPSNDDDGWGVAISEGLLCGCYAIATGSVGSSVLLENPHIGCCVPRNSPKSIAETIINATASGYLENSQREFRRQWADQKISSKAGVQYFIKIINYIFITLQDLKTFIRINVST